MQLRAARPPAARDSQPQMLFSKAPQLPRRAARGPAAPRRASGGLRGVKLLKLVVRTLDACPFAATLGLETLRGAKAVALPARAIIRADFIVQIYPLLVCLTTDHDDMSTSR